EKSDIFSQRAACGSRPVFYSLSWSCRFSISRPNLCTRLSDMRALLKQLFGLIAALVLIYGVALAVAYVLYPPEFTTGLDTRRAGETNFMTEPKYFFLNRAPLRSHKEKIVLLGASNVVIGFQRDQIQPLIKNAVVHSLGMGGANITEISQSYYL